MKINFCDSGIKIKKKNKGKFTDYCGGKVTDECIQKGKNSSNPTTRKRATFAANVRAWKHKNGGSVSKPFNHRSILDNGWISTKELKKKHPQLGIFQDGGFLVDYQSVQKPETSHKNWFDLLEEPDFEEPDFKEQSVPVKQFRYKYPTQASSNSGVVDLARKFLGTKYTWGGTNPNQGFDCSGLIQYVYKQKGINLPRTVRQLANVGTQVSLQDAKPGDLVIQASKASPTGRHVRLVSKVDNGQIYTIDARGRKYGVVEEPLSGNTISVRRV